MVLCGIGVRMLFVEDMVTSKVVELEAEYTDGYVLYIYSGSYNRGRVRDTDYSAFRRV